MTRPDLPGSGVSRAGQIAITGMACLFPGACDLASFWMNIVCGRDAIRDATEAEWDPLRFFAAEGRNFDRIYCSRGGFITELAEFNPLEFGVMPNSVSGSDPDQLLALRVASDALDDAGITSGSFDADKAEVIIGRISAPGAGAMNLIQHGQTVDQVVRILAQARPDLSGEELNAIAEALEAQLRPCNSDTIPGVMPSLLAGRIASRLGFRGKNLIVDAACASSLIAVELGVHDLLSGRADLVLAGGVHVNSMPYFYQMFCGLGALSRTGAIRPFDQDADGTILGEGVGMVVLRRLEDAVKHGERIYAVIKGVGSSSDGRTGSSLAPNVEGEALALTRAYTMAGISPTTVGLLEAHGTATRAGDLAEIKAVESVFLSRAGAGKSDGEGGHLPWCALGSVKSMIGHCQGASGIAGLIKAALSLYHRILPPTLNVTRPNPEIDWSRSPCYINSQARPWINAEYKEERSHPRRAAVSAFGFGGVNAHAVLEEYGQDFGSTDNTLITDWDTELCLIAGESTSKLLARTSRLAEFLKHNTNAALKDIAYTLSRTSAQATGTTPRRAALVASSLADLTEKLRAFTAHLERAPEDPLDGAAGVYYSGSQAAPAGELALVLPGLGAAYPQMLMDLCFCFPEVRAVFDFVDLLATRVGDALLPSRLIFPVSPAVKGWPAATSATLALMDSAVCTVLLAEWALFSVLRNLEITPQAVMGCSTGEFAALTMCGSADIVEAAETFYKLSIAVARSVPYDSLRNLRSLKTGASYEAVRPLLESLKEPVYLSADMTESEAIFSGNAAAITEFSRTLSARGIDNHLLPAAIPYHTPLVSGIVDADQQEVLKMALAPPAIPAWSCSLGQPYPDDIDEMRRITTRLFERPIRFKDTVEAIYASGVRTFVEVGPKGALCPYISAVLQEKPHLAVPANVHNRSAITQINHMLASLFCRGVPMNLDYLFRRRQPEIIDFTSESAHRAAPGTVTLTLTYPELNPPEIRDIQAPGFRLQSGVGPLAPAAAGGGDRAAGTSGLQALAAQSRKPTTGEEATGPAASMPAADSGQADVLAAYLDTLNRFHTNLMRTQEQVMLAYLEGSRESEDQDGFALAIPQLSSAPGIPGIAASDPEFNGNGHSQGAIAAHAGGRLASTSTPDAALRPGPSAFLAEAQIDVSQDSARAFLTLDLDQHLFLIDHAIGGTVFQGQGEPLRVHLLPLMVALEIMAESAALLAPDKVAVKIGGVRAYKRINVGRQGYPLLVLARRAAEATDSITVELRNAQDDLGAGGLPLMSCQIDFAAAYPPAPPTSPFEMSEARPARLAPGDLYGPDTMFHGRRMQSVTALTRVAARAISGKVAIRPMSGWFAGPCPGQPGRRQIIDPLLLDNASQLVLFHLIEHRMPVTALLPFYIESIECYRSTAGASETASVQARLHSITDRQTEADVEVSGEDGALALRISRITSRRITLPSHLVEFVKRPADTLISSPAAEHLSVLPDSAGWQLTRLDSSNLPEDESTLDWLTDYLLSPAEQRYWSSRLKAEKRRREWLMGRIAAKDSVRLLSRAQLGLTLCPADIDIASESGRPAASGFWQNTHTFKPALSIAHKDGVAVAIAGPKGAAVGIDIENVEPREPGFEEMSLSARERQLLESAPPARRDEMLTAMWCAKEAAGKAWGTGLAGDPHSLQIERIDDQHGTLALTVRRKDPGPTAEDTNQTALVRAFIENREENREVIAIGMDKAPGHGQYPQS